MPDKIRIPQHAKLAAREGLRLRSEAKKSDKFGLDRNQASRLGISSGVERARQLIKNKFLKEDDAKAVARFYMRFKNCTTEKCEGALLLWGGRKFGRLMEKTYYG